VVEQFKMKIEREEKLVFHVVQYSSDYRCVNITQTRQSNSPVLLVGHYGVSTSNFQASRRTSTNSRLKTRHDQAYPDFALASLKFPIILRNNFLNPLYRGDLQKPPVSTGVNINTPG
jgi:hypothetical protein